MRPLLIFPCNGNGLEALDCLGDEFEFVGYIDDMPAKQGQENLGFAVFDRSVLARRPDALILAAPGSPTSFRQRRRIIEGLGVDPERFATVVHPSARISRLATLGRNVLIMAGVVVTSNAVIGDHVCILPNSVIHHDVNVGSWTLVGSGVTVAGSTRIGENCYIGSGTSVANGIAIGDGALVGLGSNVIRSVSPASVVAGNPARTLK